MPDPPSLSDVERLAERALGHAAGEAQVTVLWESGELTVDFTAVVEGRAARARAAGTDDDKLRRAGRAAVTLARRPRAWPSAGLPDPVAGRSHDGFDPAVLRPAPAEVPSPPGLEVTVDMGASRIAIASTRGVRAAEQRSYAVAEVAASEGPRTVRLRRAAIGPGWLDLDGLVADAGALRFPEDRGRASLPTGDLPVVLGHDAVATVLDHLRAGFGVELDLGAGPFAGRFGTRVAAAAVNLSDSARYRTTLPRAFDAEGLPRRPVPLIQDGVAHRRVHDTASAARSGAQSTGHATRAAALAPMPEHLVLVGGGASGIEELCAPIAHGAYVPALSLAREADGWSYVHATVGAVLIDAGELRAPVADVELLVDPVAVLAGVQALTAYSRVVPLRGHAPGGIGAAVVPALRTMDGCRRRNDRN